MRGTISAICASDSSTPRLTLRRLWVSEADRNTPISSKRSRCSSALSRPRGLGTSTLRDTPSGTCARSSTSTASASWGITSARTKLVSSMRRTPAAASSSIRRTLSSVAIRSGSFWKPSRGPTSRTLTRSGKSMGGRYKNAAGCPLPRPALPEQRLEALVVLGRDRARLGHRVGQLDQLDPRSPQGGHRPPTPLVGGVDRGQPQPRGQHAVRGGGRPPALDVAQHGGPGLEAGALLDLALEPVADASQAHVPELVCLLATGAGVQAAARHRALGHHHDREIASAGVAPAQRAAHLAHVERALGDQ